MSNQTMLDVGSPASGYSSAVAWPAIFAGAVVAAASSLVLLILGSGLGLAIVSPWAMAGAGATTFAVSTAIWLIVIQWLSSGLGGYVTGRLRTRFVGVHPDEVYFRDTAHGLLTWAVATLLVAGLFGSTLSAIVDRSASAVTSVATGAAEVATSVVAEQVKDGTFMPSDYMIDTMFRPASPASLIGSPANVPPANADSLKAEATNIIAASIASGQVSDPDKAQLASIIAARTGMSPAEAQKRVDETAAALSEAKVKAQAVAESARKAGLLLALVTCLSLIIGAFIASVAAAFGGALRDDDNLSDARVFSQSVPPDR